MSKFFEVNYTSSMRFTIPIDHDLGSVPNGDKEIRWGVLYYTIDGKDYEVEGDTFETDYKRPDGCFDSDFWDFEYYDFETEEQIVYKPKCASNKQLCCGHYHQRNERCSVRGTQQHEESGRWFCWRHFPDAVEFTMHENVEIISA